MFVEFENDIKVYNPYNNKIQHKKLKNKMKDYKIEEVLLQYKKDHKITKKDFLQYIKKRISLTSQQFTQLSDEINTQNYDEKVFKNKIQYLFQFISAIQNGKNRDQNTIKNCNKIKLLDPKNNPIEITQIQSNLIQSLISKQTDIKEIQQVDQKVSQKLKQPNENNEQIDIRTFEKKGQDFMNPIIKYQIIKINKKDNKQIITWRRYSQIQKLLKYLKWKFQGIALPQMPPKEGIIKGATYFFKYGVDQNFLQSRKNKLKHILNRLISYQDIREDPIFKQFLEIEEFQIPNFDHNDGSYYQTFKDVKDVVCNMNDLKGYGKAYWKYMFQTKKNIETECSKKYKQIEPLIQTILDISEHYHLIKNNFEKRREIMENYKFEMKDFGKIQIEKQLQNAEIQCEQLKKQYGKYLQLKSTQDWQNILIKQETSKKQKLQDKKTTQRVQKAQINLEKSINNFQLQKTSFINKFGNQIILWRKKIFVASSEKITSTINL